MWYVARNSKAVLTLHPLVQEKVRQLLERLEAMREDVLIYSAGRTSGQQDVLYMQGRKGVPGERTVTDVDDSNSYHTWGLAIDLVPITLGIPMWKAYHRFQQIAREAKVLGFEWGLEKWGLAFGDYGHLHFSQGLTIADLKAGKTLERVVLNDIREPRIEISPIFRPVQRFKKRLKVLVGRNLERLLLSPQRKLKPFYS